MGAARHLSAVPKDLHRLAHWLAPSAPFTLHCRQQACEHIAAGDTAEQAAPHCKDPAHLPDPSTVRRWAQRRLVSLLVLDQGRNQKSTLSADADHPRLGSGPALPYSADRGKKSVSRQALDELKQQIPLLDYLQAHDWQPARQLSHGRLMGLCPLHEDHKPSFLVDPHKSLFYCYGRGCGGDVIHFAELYHQVKFPQALSLFHQWRGLPPLLHEAAGFYRMQLFRHGEAVAYLQQRGIHSPELIEHMQIGHAPGGCLRAHLMQLGYPLQVWRQAGL